MLEIEREDEEELEEGLEEPSDSSTAISSSIGRLLEEKEIQAFPKMLEKERVVGSYPPQITIEEEETPEESLLEEIALEEPVMEIEEEEELNLNKSFEHEIVIKEGDQIMIYAAKISGFHIRNLGRLKCLFGKVRLTKYHQQKIVQTRLKLIQFFPPKFKHLKIPVIYRNKLWKIGDSIGEYTPFGNFRQHTPSFAYKNDLKRALFKWYSKILKDEIIEAAFNDPTNSIEKKISTFHASLSKIYDDYL